MTNSIDSSNRTIVQASIVQEKKPISFSQNVMIGSISGISAVSILQPMMYFKNMRQRNVVEYTKEMQSAVFRDALKMVIKNPRMMYMGGGTFAASFGPAIAIQTAVKGVFPENFNPIVASALAGMASGGVVCPTECLIIQQQKTSLSFRMTAKRIYVSHGMMGFFRGFIPTVAREGGFAAAYLGLVPIVKMEVESQGFNGFISQLVAGIVGGIIGGVVSHPFDTRKTQFQSDFKVKIPIKTIFQRAAFAGFNWRMGMVITATTVMPSVQEKLKTIMI